MKKDEIRVGGLYLTKVSGNVVTVRVDTIRISGPYFAGGGREVTVYDVTNLSTEGLPIRGLDAVDFLAMAQGAGYAKTYQFDNLEELFIGLEEALVQPGPVFVLVKVVRDTQLPDFPDRPMAQGWAAVRRTLLSQG